MSKILVIEPLKMLQQAICLALCPDHEVHLDLLDKDPIAIKDYDIAIIDAAALRNANVLNTLRVMEEWKIPKIWIDEAERVQAPRHNKFVVLTKPIQKETLQSAVATCLGASAARRQNGAGRQPAQETGSSETTASDSGAAAGPIIIDLVDVIEESPERKSQGRRQRKTK
jgi:hypothetical protein